MGKITAMDILQKPLSFNEACEYLGYKKSYMYKLTASKIIPLSKPNGGRMFFDKQKLNDWLLSNQSSGFQERETQAATYVTTH